MDAKFIVIEGLEGAGKSSAVATVANWLEHNNHRFIKVREPGGTPFAESLRTLVKQDWDETISAEAELMLMYASRVQLVNEIIKPAIARGDWVIGDRHDLSSRAYQGGGRELGDEPLRLLKELTLGEFKPDLTLYLDINPDIGLKRASARGALDRIEQENRAFFERTRNRYIELAAQDPTIVTIDASQPLELVQQQITESLDIAWRNI